MTEDETSKALNHVDWHVRFWTIQHPNATSENINKALNDSGRYIRKIITILILNKS